MLRLIFNLFIFACFAAFPIGWVMNLYKLIAHVDTASLQVFVLRIVGMVLAPIGSLLGFFL